MSNDIERDLVDWLPKPGDRLFIATETGLHLDPLGLTPRGEERQLAGRWQLYAEGFLSAADRLVDSCQAHPHEHDPQSQAGRFPVDRQEAQTLTRLEIVDLQALRLGVSKVSHYLSTIIEQIGQDREWEAEMASW